MHPLSGSLLHIGSPRDPFESLLVLLMVCVTIRLLAYVATS